MNTSAQTILPESSAFVDAEPVVENDRHRALADGVLAGKSATQSAIDLGYSVRTASAQATMILKQPHVAAYLAYHRRQSSNATKINVNSIAEELSDMAFFNPKDLATFDDDGNITGLNFQDATEAQFKVITKVKTKRRDIRDNKGNVIATETETEVGLADKYRGLELLGKHLGMFKEADSKVIVDVADRLLAARQRTLSIGNSDAEDGQ